MSKKHKCAGVVGRRGQMGTRYGACNHPGIHREQAKWWCGIHQPGKVKARLDANEEKARAEISRKAAVRSARYATVRAEATVVEAARAWARARLAWAFDPSAKNQEAMNTTFATLRDASDALVST